MEPTKGRSKAVSQTVKENVLRQSPSPPPPSNTGEHPLLNPLVVDVIVKHLNPNFEQLKTLRLVSKVWTHATLNRWRKSSAVLTLIPDTMIFTRTKYKTGLPISRFVREFQDPESPFQLSEKPFSKYKLKGMNLDFEVCSEPGGESNKIWSAIGPLMEYVHFDKVEFNTRVNNQFHPEYTCPLVKFLVGLIPNLKDLALTEVTIAGVENADDDPSVAINEPHLNLRTLTVYGKTVMDWAVRLEDLMKSAPNLELIKGVNAKRHPENHHTLLASICKVRSKTDAIPRPLSNLKQVDLINSAAERAHYWNERIPPPSKTLPNETQIPLETLALHLDVKPATSGTACLDEYLKSFSSTLKILNVFRAPVEQESPPRSNFLLKVSWNALTELYLWGAIAPDFGFLTGTPNLKKLRIDLGCFEKRDTLKVIIRRNNHNYDYEKYQSDMVLKVGRNLKGKILCTEMEYLEIDYDFPDKSLKLLGKWMPNLKTLKTILNGETVPVVCQVWNDLTELVCLHGSKIENSCVIRDEKTAGFSRGPRPKLKISDLNGLERFQLDAYCKQAKLTDVAVFKGFLKMPALQSVEIRVNARMSVAAEEALRKSVQFCKVIRDNHGGCCGTSAKQFLDFRCDRCAFRRETDYFDLGDNGENDDSDESEEDDESDHEDEGPFWSMSDVEYD